MSENIPHISSPLRMAILKALDLREYLDSKYRVLCESLAVSWALIDPSTQEFLEFNEHASADLGFTREEFSKLTLANITFQELPALRYHARQIVTSPKKKWNWEGRFRNKMGVDRMVEINASAVEIAGRWLVNASWQDITDRKRSEEELRRSREHLAQQVAERTAELRALNARLLSVQDEERRRLGRELHDGIGQELCAMKMRLDTIESTELKSELEQLSEFADSILQQVRAASYLLHPPLLEESGLSSALRWFVCGITERAELDIQLEIVPEQFPRLKPDTETSLYRIVQECVANAIKHSGSGNLDISLKLEKSKIFQSVRDYGCGLTGHPQGVGISGMQERVALLRGSIEIGNADPGVEVKVTLPWGD